MTGTMTNPLSVDLRLWKEDRFYICPYLTFVTFIGLLLLLYPELFCFYYFYTLNCFTTLSSIKNLDFMILMLLLFHSSIDFRAFDLLRNLY